jgi:hypothetical protein
MFATAKRSLLLASLLGAAGLYLPASSLAATATVTGTLTGSKLTVSTTAAPGFTANLDNGDSTPTYTLPLTVQDTRGTGAGWNLTVLSSQFSTGGATPNTLAANASSMTGVVATPTGNSTNPTNSVTYPLGVPTTAPAVKFFNAAVNTGMGSFTVTPTVGVFVPQNSFAGTYTSNVTVAIVSGP